MINEMNAKRFCCEDISKIYGYNEAIADKTHMWDIHHTLGLVFTKDELIKKGLYYKQPAENLMFVTRSQHSILHSIVRNSWNKGKSLSEEHKAKIGASNRGKHRSEETKAKISASEKGEKHSKARAVYQIDKNTGEIIKKWMCIREATRALDIPQSNISVCCRGIYKQAGGFCWRYAD